MGHQKTQLINLLLSGDSFSNLEKLNLIFLGYGLMLLHHAPHWCLTTTPVIALSVSSSSGRQCLKTPCQDTTGCQPCLPHNMPKMPLSGSGKAILIKWLPICQLHHQLLTQKLQNR